MTNERELDSAIDAAAGAMMAREPSRSLGYTVMARVRDEHAPAPRRFVWVTAAASLVVCGAIAMTLISQTPAIIAPLPRAAELTVGQPPVLPSASVTIVAGAAPAHRPIHIVRSTPSATTRAPLPPSDVSSIEPIETDPIVLSSINVPQLERETTAVDALNVEPLTIEPLAASND
jgi:hypothetical protein